MIDLMEGFKGREEMLDYLRFLFRNEKELIEKVTLIGLCTDICVLANAVLAKTALPEAHITVDASCTASFQPALHEAALDVMEGLQIDVFNRKDGAL